ncbi:54S ribosomal protein L7, mitochondrial [Ophidiomyces ophidiicola]|uniref:54S ribosomal protein L7, mitochondrial n=1 Tax=Ophidiomyces ophidiicola TaxID=1387563 RepID=A0ACB8UYH0_9EURO|nr:54S ribosomal protein L7, mitochondrial [Ophidiomyces ophidiicola]KAI1909085.1 54S ribosomal protein L7, mitochondrial [Ophidiomyces ophidiicola]KAI1918687.1 54S ribosomal protein L7, mitochondrial [Ophidiomyces ophidiicola]KAI1922965.1 54S ribosomal protein L7, mitochondrial [Ophidiomyces ophidiicola]KAI1944288.1 54S ribosomal protein L7, mitochondrial [Ophidiomyces ophidiicola]KAI1949514.1 54S ribosomal protein L7, mitochondrial [Ophidiomyces ophidiicola]
MALHEPLGQFSKAFVRRLVTSVYSPIPSLRRNVSDNASDRVDLAETTFYEASQADTDVIQKFDPIARSRARRQQLPRSRYQFRSPKYDKGPLHPHRPPPEWDPSSRLFVPGPFSNSRVEQTYESTIAPDILTLCYVHNPPGFTPPPKSERLRSWGDSSPYHKNRSLRGPRGGDVLRLLRKPITFRNIPKLEKITVHSYIKEAISSGSAPLHVGGMVIQAITNVRAETHTSRSSVPKWGITPGKNFVSVTAELRGENMYHFFGKLVDVVMPRIKDWKGVKGSSGDSSGNITLGLDPQVVALFPEIEVNYDMYPPKMIPGCHITIHTSARMDKDARLLLSAMGIPFYGKFVN